MQNSVSIIFFFSIGFFFLLPSVGANSLSLEEQQKANEAHKTAFAKDNYPSANACQTCHQKHFLEWSVSPHAYAQISPIFNTMQEAVNVLTNGTNSDFCIRCHSPVGMALGEPVFMPNSQRNQAALEGVTCIACHRVNKSYGKISGRVDINRGDIFQSVTGPAGGENLDEMLADNEAKLTTNKETRGRKIHAKIEKFLTLTEPGFCATCHDVNSVTTLRLEEAFSEFKNTPAAKRGETCQDCHMGKVPGIVSGYEKGSAAKIAGISSKERKLTNHMFIGPDYSIVHPGIFPHNREAQNLASIDEWISFDYKQGWGTDEFEDSIDEDFEFPPRWEDVDDRYDAQAIIEDQLDLLEWANEDRLTLLQQGYQLGNVNVLKNNNKRLTFEVEVNNGTDGHMVPTGFIAERLVYLEVSVLDKNGKVVFISGDLDKNGDVRDHHSVEVHDGNIAADPFLFSLQSKFITRSIRGGEREQVLPINFSLDPLPFARPARTPTVLSGRPRGVRIHKKSIPPLGTLKAKYSVSGKALGNNGPYVAKIRLYAQMVPVNLIHAIQVVPFDYGMSAQDVATAVIAGKLLLSEKTVDLE